MKLEFEAIGSAVKKMFALDDRTKQVGGYYGCISLHWIGKVFVKRQPANHSLQDGILYRDVYRDVQTLAYR